MKVTTVLTALGGAAAVGGAVWFLLGWRGTVSVAHGAGQPLALGVAALGAVVLAAALLVARRRRRAEAALDVELNDDDYDEWDDDRSDVWPTIVVRRHGRPRPPRGTPAPTAPTWDPPSSPDDRGGDVVPLSRHQLPLMVP